MNPEERLIKKCMDTVKWWSREVLSKIMQRLYHGDWEKRSIYEIFEWAEKEMQELRDEVHKAIHVNADTICNVDLQRTNLDLIIDECRDVSAIAMMLAQKCKELKDFQDGKR